jgi:hypothetical protein
MCVPSPATQAAPTDNVQMQAADNFAFGGSNETRGAGLLGRLALRLTTPPGTPAASATTANQALAPAIAPPPAPTFAGTPPNAVSGNITAGSGTVYGFPSISPGGTNPAGVNIGGGLVNTGYRFGGVNTQNTR